MGITKAKVIHLYIKNDSEPYVQPNTSTCHSNTEISTVCKYSAYYSKAFSILFLLCLYQKYIADISKQYPVQYVIQKP